MDKILYSSRDTYDKHDLFVNEPCRLPLWGEARSSGYAPLSWLI